jgi:hypothetical protein
VKPAPPFDCAGCGKRIGKTRTHDTLDHSGSCGTRAGVAHVLGLWP